MRTASLPKIRKELQSLSPDELVFLINRLARFKKDNKELLSYLLFDAHNEPEYVLSVKDEIEQQFETINTRNLYWARKGIRRILKLTNKYIRYSGQIGTEIELRAHFCRTLRVSGIPFDRSVALRNLYQREVERVEKAVKKLHDDEQLDFVEILDGLKY